MAKPYIQYEVTVEIIDLTRLVKKTFNCEAQDAEQGIKLLQTIVSYYSVLPNKYSIKTAKGKIVGYLEVN